VSAWDVGTCARHGGTIKGEGVGVVCGDGVEGMAEQVLAGGVGGEVALEVSVVAVGNVVGVGVLGACELGDGFACGGDEFGVGELLEGAVGFGSCVVLRGVVRMRCWRWYTGCVLWCCPSGCPVL
jgi:hypothetical protein